MLSNILYIQDLPNINKRILRERATQEKFLYIKRNLKSSSLSPCGAIHLNNSYNDTQNHKIFLLPSQSLPNHLKFSYYEFNMSSNIISISAKFLSNSNNRTGSDKMKYKISINPIKHKIVKRSVIENESSDINLCGDSSATNKWIRINFGLDKNDASFQEKSAIKSTKDSTKCVQLLKSSSKKHQPLSWFQANKSCIDLGGNLVKIQSEAEELELQNLIMNR